MLLMVGQVAALAAEGGAKVSLPFPLLIEGICFFVLVALMWARRTLPFELFFAGIFFFVLGAWVGVPVLAWMNTVGH